jgi:hypothetical protein
MRRTSASSRVTLALPEELMRAGHWRRRTLGPGKPMMASTSSRCLGMPAHVPTLPIARSSTARRSAQKPSNGPTGSSDQGQDAKGGDHAAVGQPQHQQKTHDSGNYRVFVFDQQPSSSPVGLPATSDWPGPIALDSHASATTTFTAASDARDLRPLGQAGAARTDCRKWVDQDVDEFL